MWWQMCSFLTLKHSDLISSPFLLEYMRCTLIWMTPGGCFEWEHTILSVWLWVERGCAVKVLNSACLYMSLIKQKIKLIYRAPNEISRGLSGCQWSASLSHCKLKDQEIGMKALCYRTIPQGGALERFIYLSLIMDMMYDAQFNTSCGG